MAKERKENDLQNLPACAAEFIKLVIKKMRYRKKVRRDVQAELAAHFEDELKDCTSNEEREQKAQWLIGQFGDTRLLGILLRRAKKRCRPLWRTVIARTFQAAGVLILCLIIYIAWFLTGKPVITTDYVAELNRIVRPTADESLNAAPLYNKAAELYKEKSSDEISKLLGTKYNEATDEQKQLIEKWLTDNHQTIEPVIAGTQKPYYWQKYEEGKGGEGMMSVLLPHLAEFRKLTYSLRWRACLSAEQGCHEDAFDDIKTCYRFGQHIRSGKTIIEQLVAIAIEALTLQTLRDVLDEHRFDSATMDTLQQDFEQMIADEDFTVNIKTEKLLKYDVIQRCFTEGQSGHIIPKRLSRFGDMFPGPAPENIFEEFIFVFSDMSVLKTVTYMLTLHPNKQQTKETVDQLYDYWERIIHKTPAQIRAEGIDIEEEATKIIKGNILLEILLPAYQRIHQISYIVPTDVNATLAVIAILRYKQDTGNYPDSLNELITAGYIKQLPMDAFSDKPLVYKKEDDNFILYSVGHNFTDDGGQVYRDDKGRVKLWADEGDAVFWPVPKSEIKQ